MPVDRSQEFPEAALRGPFGGIQSEMPPSEIEAAGFSDCVNMILRDGKATVRNGYQALAALGEPAVGIADFYRSDGVRVQVVITPTRLKQWNPTPQDWTDVAAVAPLLGVASHLFNWTSLNYKLLFSQGDDKVQLWDGVTPTFAAASANAPAARFLMELDFHLIAAYTTESGNVFPQRFRWCSANDPTDWTGFNAGVQDLVNSLGPIQGLAKLYGYGYIIQRFGVTRLIPTGLGLRPFDTQSFSADGKGSLCPYSLASFGEEMAFYVGESDIYQLSGSEIVGVGARLVEGNRRLGARNFIYAELDKADLNAVTGYVTTNIAGDQYNAYWLVIPNGSVWQYNIDEKSWARWVFDKPAKLVGRFSQSNTIRIIDLVGSIAQQTWSPATLASTQGIDHVMVGFADAGNTIGNLDHTSASESPWTISSGEISVGDYRHTKSVNRFRLVYQDLGPVVFVVQLENEFGFVVRQQVSCGTGSGLVRSVTLAVKISGLWIKWTVSGAAQQQASFVEFGLVYDLAGEYKDHTGVMVLAA